MEKELISLRMIDKILPSKEEFFQAIKQKRLRFYFGIDPTSPDLHLGHTPSLWFLRDMQILGHEVIVLLGDFTAQIGDPTGKDQTRPKVLPEQIKKNLSGYKSQIMKILDFKDKKNPAKIVRNSKWWGKMKLSSLIDIASHFTIQQLIERDMFQRRMKEEKPITLSEFIYPLFQGYDSVFLEADGEVGGADQLFNMLIGKKLREIYQNKTKFVIAMKLLIDEKTGKKMSKSEGNYIPLNLSPDDLYGKIMALPDGMIWPCFELATNLSDFQIKSLKQKFKEFKEGKDLKILKEILAHQIVKQFYGGNKADEVKENFEKITKEELKNLKKQEFKVLYVNKNQIVKAIDLVASLRNVSKSEALRLIEGGALHLYKKNSKESIVIREKYKDILLEDYDYIRIGKRKAENFYKIELK
jgi:tyrosyl-tRNA synthetase